MKVFFEKIGSLFKGKCGYTLTELSISTSIIAMLAVGGLAVLQKKNDSAKYKETYTKISAIDNALKSFINTNNYIPCPATASTVEGSSTFGTQVSYDSTNKICNGSSLANETGAVPVKTLGLPDDYAYDGWGRKFMYRSSSASGASGDFTAPNFRGNIAILDLKGTHKTNINDIAPYNDGAIYVIISYGANGKNVAYRRNNTTTPSQASGIEATNTDHTKNVYIQNEKTSSFDDIVTFGTSARLHNQRITESPIKIQDITCNTAQSIVSNGRSSATLNTYAASNSNAYTSHADTIYKSAQIIADLCKNRQAAETVMPDRFSGLKLWLDAADTPTVYTTTNCSTGNNPANNARIKCWQDKSANSFNATDLGVSTSDPTFITNALNKKPILRSSANQLSIGTGLLNSLSGGNITAFLVSSASQDNTPLRTSPSDGTNNFYIYLPNTGQQRVGWQFGSSLLFTMSWNQSFNTYYIWTFKASNNSSQNMWLNGSLFLHRDSSETPNFGSSYNLVVGNRGDLGEVLIYNTGLSDTDRQKIEEYLSDKWAISLTGSLSTCDAGMTFQKTSSDPAGSCQCPSGQVFIPDIKTNSACYSNPTNVAFGKCVDVASAPTYSSSPSLNNMVLWLDANDCTTLTLSGSGTNAYVSKWSDKSPKGSDAAQSTFANMPQYLPNTINGLPVLKFDGTADYMDNTTLALSTTASVFAVASTGSGTSWKRIINNENNFYLGVGSTTNYFGSFYGNGSSWGTTSDHGVAGIMTAGKYYILSSINDGTNDISFINGNTLPTRANTMTAFSNGYTIGHPQTGPVTGQYWDGNIGEIIMYNTAISNKEHSDVESYLSFKWGIPLLPSDIGAPTLGGTGPNLKLWLDASDPTTLFTKVLKDGSGNDTENCDTSAPAYTSSKIGCWKDKSGNNYNAVQTLASSQPSYAFGTSATINSYTGSGVAITSYPTVLFDGIGTYLSNSTFALSTKASIFAVASPGLNVTQKRIISHQTGGSTYFFFGLANNANFKSYYSSGTYDSTSTGYSATTTAGTFYVFTSINNGSDTAYLNSGTALYSRADAMSAFSDGYKIGLHVQQGWDGPIGEIIIYNTNLSDANRIAVERYLGNKWGITLN